MLFNRVLIKDERVDKIVHIFSFKPNSSTAYLITPIEAMWEAPSQLVLQLYIVFGGQTPGNDFIYQN